MTKRRSDMNGFSVIELVLVIVILGLIVVAGVYVSHHHKKTTTAKATTTTQPAKVTNVYAGWKSYCDTSANLCFKYPTNWTVGAGSGTTAGTGTVETIINATATADVQYGNVVPSVGDPTSVFTTNPESSTPPASNLTVDLSGQYNFFTTSITNVASSSSYKVIGGYYASAAENIPSYFVINASSVASLGLTVGKSATLTKSAFNISDSAVPTNIILFGGGPIALSSYSPAQAAAWLTSSDGATVKQLMQSFSTN